MQFLFTLLFVIWASACSADLNGTAGGFNPAPVTPEITAVEERGSTYIRSYPYNPSSPNVEEAGVVAPSEDAGTFLPPVYVKDAEPPQAPADSGPDVWVAPDTSVDADTPDAVTPDAVVDVNVPDVVVEPPPPPPPEKFYEIRLRYVITSVNNGTLSLSIGITADDPFPHFSELRNHANGYQWMSLDPDYDGILNIPYNSGWHYVGNKVALENTYIRLFKGGLTDEVYCSFAGYEGWSYRVDAECSEGCFRSLCSYAPLGESPPRMTGQYEVREVLNE